MFTPLQFIKVQKLMNLKLYLTYVHMLFASSIFCAGSHNV